MKKNKLVVLVLGGWTLVICFIIGKNIFDDVKNINDIKPSNNVIENNFTINSSVGDFKKDEIEANEEKEGEQIALRSNEVAKEVNVNNQKEEDIEEKKIELENNDLKENKIVAEKYGTIVYDEITYEIKNGIKTKKSVERLIDNSNYKASLTDLKKEAINMVEDNREVSNEVLLYTNKYREEVGKSSLVLDDNLSLVANIRALELAYYNVFSHTRPDGSKVNKLASDLKISYKTMGENIAYGYQNSEKVTTGWKNSKGHYENMINSNYNKIGIGLINFYGNIYWVQIFSD